MCVAVSHVPVCPPALVGQSLLAQHPDVATQIPAVAHFLGVVPPQVNPQLVPSQVAVAPVGAEQVVQLWPQVAGDVLSTQVPEQACLPEPHVIMPPPVPFPMSPPAAPTP